MKQNLVGRIAFIKENLDSCHAGGWGVIVAIEGDEYHIAMYEDENFCAVFARNEFVIHRAKKA